MVLSSTVSAMPVVISSGSAKGCEMVQTIAVVASLSGCWAFSISVIVSASVACVVAGVCCNGILMYGVGCFGCT